MQRLRMIVFCFVGMATSTTLSPEATRRRLFSVHCPTHLVCTSAPAFSIEHRPRSRPICAPLPVLSSDARLGAAVSHPFGSETPILPRSVGCRHAKALGFGHVSKIGDYALSGTVFRPVGLHQFPVDVIVLSIGRAASSGVQADIIVCLAGLGDYTTLDFANYPRSRVAERDFKNLHMSVKIFVKNSLLTQTAELRLAPLSEGDRSPMATESSTAIGLCPLDSRLTPRALARGIGTASSGGVGG